MCQSQANGGIRCISDTKKELKAAEESGNEELIAAKKVEVAEAERLSLRAIVKDEKKVVELKESEKPDDGEKAAKLGKVTQARREERETKQAANIAAHKASLAARVASFVPDLIATIKSKWSEFLAKAQYGEEGQIPLRELATHEDWNVRAAVGLNTSTPADVLEQLSKDSDPRVRAAVAYNHAAEPELLAELYKDKDPQIQENLAANQQTPVEILAEQAATKPVPIKIRLALATNTSTPAQTLAGYYIPKKTLYTGQLAMDEGNERLAHNWNTPVHILEKLAKSNKRITRAAAKKTLLEVEARDEWLAEEAKLAEAELNQTK